MIDVFLERRRGRDDGEEGSSIKTEESDGLVILSLDEVILRNLLCPPRIKQSKN
jgi:hypothetical protein